MKSQLIVAGLAAGLALGLAGPSAEAQQRRERANLTRPTEGFTYYNRPGATIADHDAAVRACAARAMGLNQMADNVLMPGLAAQGLAAAQDGSRLQANIENCMVVDGWRVVRLPDGIGQRLFRMKREELSPQLATVVGVKTPEIGQIVRVFDNEAARGDTVWGAMPAYYGEDSISLKAVDMANLPDALPALAPLHPDRQTAQSGPVVPIIELTPANVASVPQETAMVIIRVVGTGRTNGEGLGIGRVGFRSEPPVIRRVATDPVEGFYAGVNWTLFKGSDRERRESLIAIPVVPGEYRIESRMNTMEYCLGAPVTEVKAGEVVFLGTFDIAGPVMGPDMSLTPAETFLANDPARRSRLRPAQWRNGNVAACGLVYFYALEIPGAPYEPGYTGGRSPRTVSPVAAE
jgi:hypothetical protein